SREAASTRWRLPSRFFIPKGRDGRPTAHAYAEPRMKELFACPPFAVPTYETTRRFERDFEALARDQQRAFREAIRRGSRRRQRLPKQSTQRCAWRGRCVRDDVGASSTLSRTSPVSRSRYEDGGSLSDVSMASSTSSMAIGSKPSAVFGKSLACI